MKDTQGIYEHFSDIIFAKMNLILIRFTIESMQTVISYQSISSTNSPHNTTFTGYMCACVVFMWIMRFSLMVIIYRKWRRKETNKLKWTTKKSTPLIQAIDLIEHTSAYIKIKVIDTMAWNCVHHVHCMDSKMCSMGLIYCSSWK